MGSPVPTFLARVVTISCFIDGSSFNASACFCSASRFSLICFSRAFAISASVLPTSARALITAASFIPCGVFSYAFSKRSKSFCSYSKLAFANSLALACRLSICSLRLSVSASNSLICLSK